MSHIAYVNGRYLPHAEAAVHVEDRGYQFADGVYEVIGVYDGHLVDSKSHFERLGHSLDGLAMNWPMGKRSLEVVIGEMIRRNRLRHGFIYMQVTRGVARRNHLFPQNSELSLVLTARHSKPLDNNHQSHGISIITIPDTRWKRCDIKSISLLANVLGKQQAVDAGADEAWMVDDNGLITEGTSSNAWILTTEGELLTRDSGIAVLDGITRRVVLQLAGKQGINFNQRAFSVDEAMVAAEAFITSTTSPIKPVISIDNKIIGDGQPGAVYFTLAALYAAYLQNLE